MTVIERNHAMSATETHGSSQPPLAFASRSFARQPRLMFPTVVVRSARPIRVARQVTSRRRVS
jgi:hypothetical protein